MAPKSRSRPKKEPTPEPSSSSDPSEDSEHETNSQALPDNADDGKDSSSESDSESGEAKYEVKPISDLSKKRSAESSAVGTENSKRSKTDVKKPNGKTPIARVWSEEDEIALLNGIVEFKNRKGSLPRNVGELVVFLKGKLGMSFSPVQIRDKIRRMKSRFSNALKKRTDGKDPVFSDPHELIAYEISKTIWDDELGNVESNDSKDISNGEEDDGAKETDAEVVDFWSKYPCLSASFEALNVDSPAIALSGGGVSLVKERLELIGDAKAKELNDKWKELLMEEIELHHKKLGLMIEQVKLALV